MFPCINIVPNYKVQVAPYMDYLPTFGSFHVVSGNIHSLKQLLFQFWILAHQHFYQLTHLASGLISLKWIEFPSHPDKLQRHQKPWKQQVGHTFFCRQLEKVLVKKREPLVLIELNHALGDIHWCLIAVIERLGISLNIEVKSLGNRFIAIDQDRCLPPDRVWFGCT